jgi:hypothetical protein
MRALIRYQLLFSIVPIVTCFFVGCLPTEPFPIKEMKNELFTPEAVGKLQQLVESTIEDNLRNRILRADRNAAWQVIHGAVAFGSDLPLQVDGQIVPALDYLFAGGDLPGWDLRAGDLIPATKRVGIRTSVEEGSFTGQGHVDQFLGYLSQAAIPLTTPIQVNGKEFLLEDLARQAQRDICQNPYREYSWTLIAMCNYFPNDSQWQGTDGNMWSLESCVALESEQDLGSSACGGMHRLMGLAHAVRCREKTGGRMEGGWLKAKQVVQASIEKAKRFQNSDGSFSTRYTVRPGNSADLSTCLSATGHTLEFLAYALNNDELAEPWVENGVAKLCQMLELVKDNDLECGGIYHALAGLKLYARKRLPPK